MPENNENTVVEEKGIEQQQEDDFINTLLEDDDEDEEVEDEVVEDEQPVVENKEETEKQKAEEEKRRKNKDAEEARKRREAEKKKAQEDKQEQKRNALGEQLVKFKEKYTDVDLGELDKDKHFKRFISGRVGKVDFTTLYEEFVEMTGEIGGKKAEEITAKYQKANASSGTSQAGTTETQDIYSEDEFAKLLKRMPYMNDKELNTIFDKFERTRQHYKNKK